jgi:hypothetical protein
MLIHPQNVAAAKPFLGDTQPVSDLFLLGAINGDIVLRAARATDATARTLEAQPVAVIKGRFGHVLIAALLWRGEWTAREYHHCWHGQQGPGQPSHALNVRRVPQCSSQWEKPNTQRNRWKTV